MSETGWPEENWVTLGEAIANARRSKGWDQRQLADRSGNSANTISNYERGRPTRSRRVPSGIQRVAQALRWPPNAAQEILAGGDPEVILNQPDLYSLMAEEGEKVGAGTEFSPDPAPDFVAPLLGLADARSAELTESGYIAQDTFLRQMKRYRRHLDVSVELLAERIEDLGGGLNAADLIRLENGTRQLRMADAELIATALGTSVDWLLGSAFSPGVPPVMQAPPTAEELQAEAKAVERRIFDQGSRVTAARTQYEQAKRQEEEARRAAQWALAIFQQNAAQKAELERHYQYLIGRIDSLRAASGNELIMQVYPAMEASTETIGQRLNRARREAEMTIEDVYSLTRIRPDIVEAIERDDYDWANMDEGARDVYARGYIRVLARAFGLDPAPLVALYDAEHAHQPLSATSATQKTTRPPRRVVRVRRKNDGDQ